MHMSRFSSVLVAFCVLLALGSPGRAASDAGDSTASVADTCVDLRTGAPFEFRARHVLATAEIDSEWTPGADQLCLRSLEGLQRNVLADGTGGAYVAWVDNHGLDSDILLRRLANTGETAIGWPTDGLPVCQAPHSQYQLDLAGDGSGGLFLAWQDYRGGGMGRVFVQHLTASGAVVPGWPPDGRAATDSTVEQSAPRLAADGSGGAYLTRIGCAA